jgi:predicted N-acetyltransferase YhbS
VASPASEIILRVMTADDLPAAAALSRAVQWPHRVEDWQFVHPLGRGFVASIAGTIVGAVLWWPFGEDAGSLGMLIVAPDRQRAGIGRRLTEAVIADAGERTLSLHATADGLPLYERLNFRTTGEIRQHQGAAFTVPVVPLPAGCRIRPLGRADAEAVIALDAAATGVARGVVLTGLLAACDGVILDRDGEIEGFALLRRFGRGYVIGPVVAPDHDGARALITHWVGSHAGMFLRIDVPTETGLSPWLDELGLSGVSAVPAMTRGTPPRRGMLPRTFALISQALG